LPGKLRVAGADHSSVLLIGKNGSGKTTAGLALEVLQKIARGSNRVDDLVKPKDLAGGRTEVPVRFELEVQLQAEVYLYTIAFELPPSFKELRVSEERLLVSGKPVDKRSLDQVLLAISGRQEREARFRIGWHLVALSIVQADPLSFFKQWLARMLILWPIPALIAGDSNQETLEPNVRVSNFGAWFSGLLAYAPAAYGGIDVVPQPR
jgi:hypothetical protein